MCKPRCFDIGRSFIDVGFDLVKPSNHGKHWWLNHGLSWFTDFDAELMGKPTILWDQPHQFYEWIKGNEHNKFWTNIWNDIVVDLISIMNASFIHNI